jgi:hypothetical protein
MIIANLQGLVLQKNLFIKVNTNQKFSNDFIKNDTK